MEEIPYISEETFKTLSKHAKCFFNKLFKNQNKYAKIKKEV